ncbi:hypothetical protein [Paenibacillus harenae]|uniref:hypothetical protein n=1 Tax=Paenibacillus harenae TaxID=306543 RepID=UPI0027D7F974|nr:hypothetical protein [Paenibacillus harenae]
MYKLLLILLMMTVWGSIHMMQVEEELAMQTLFLGKHAINRAAHAAAQQIDESALGNGELRIAPAEAATAAATYLQHNLRLNEAGEPLPDSFLREPVELAVFEIVNSEVTFPYVYRNDSYNYEVTLNRPSVVIIAKVAYPRAFRMLEPIEWYIKGAAELIEG